MKRYVVILLAVLVVAVGAWIGIVFFLGKDRQTSQTGTGTGPVSSAVGSGSQATREGAGDTAGSGWVSRFDPDKELEPGELVLIDPPANITSILRELNFSAAERFTFQGLNVVLMRVRVPRDMELPAARMALAARAPGMTIDYNHRFDNSQGRRHVDSAPTAADQLKRSKVLSFAQAALGWRDVPATCGAGLRLGMIDSSVDVGHPVLKDRDIEFRSFHNPDRYPGDADHGTAVAALLVGAPSETGLGGLLPGATLKAANMFEKTKTGKMVGNAVALMRAFDWMVRENVQVLNLSIAGSKNAVVERGISAVAGRGVVVVAAAGNWGRSDKPAYPAAFEQVVAVTAIDSYEGIYSHANTGNYIDFAAPGVQLLTAVPGGGSRRQSGTSFAAPFLTAILALELKAGRGGTALALRRQLAGLSKDLGPDGRDTTFGWGFTRAQPTC